MTTVGKKFPDLTVNAMNEMGDTFPLNVLKRPSARKRKFCSFGTQRTLLLSVRRSCMPFKKQWLTLKSVTLWSSELRAILRKFILHGLTLPRTVAELKASPIRSLLIAIAIWPTLLGFSTRRMNVWTKKPESFW